MIFYPQERIGLFIDGSNLYASARALNFDIDYKRLLTVFAAKGRLIRAFYYTALLDDQEYSPIRPLIDWLDYNGYAMVTKPTKEFTDASGRRKIKGNMDIELAIDVMEMAEHLDHIVLFSGDGDFRRLVEAVQRKGTRVTVVSTIRSQPPMVADELRRQADNFIEFEHRLDYGRKKPVPHESTFKIAGYFYYFGIYYFTEAAQNLPEDKQHEFAKALARIILTRQEKDGSWWDYPLYDYGQAYGTGYALMALKWCREAMP